jgi:hypothetical protein
MAHHTEKYSENIRNHVFGETNRIIDEFGMEV